MRKVLMLLPLMSFGCVASMEDAPFGAQIVMPDGMSIAWSDSVNDFDLGGYTFYMDVGVIDSSGAPLPNVRVEITSLYTGVYVMPQEAVEVVSYPGLPSGITSVEDVKAACTDDNGNYILAEDWCAWYWDTQGQQFYQFAGTYANAYDFDDTSGFYWYAPTHMVAETDNRGLVRVFGLIDVLPSGLNGFLPVSVVGSTGWSQGTFIIDPANN